MAEGLAWHSGLGTINILINFWRNDSIPHARKPEKKAERDFKYSQKKNNELRPIIRGVVRDRSTIKFESDKRELVMLQMGSVTLGSFSIPVDQGEVISDGKGNGVLNTLGVLNMLQLCKEEARSFLNH
ncbi:MAG: hypothetical protein QG670_2747 [Thermoproteota archaeon]|nr:hypothetical protein [Thermoproteota archaeon]